uniref:Uncharacterized protein n=1 Tax=Hordeum vulgare subsp. vulgare TaxID=112509 RepID=A0A8I6Y1E8_HORVV
MQPSLFFIQLFSNGNVFQGDWKNRSVTGTSDRENTLWPMATSVWRERLAGKKQDFWRDHINNFHVNLNIKKCIYSA